MEKKRFLTVAALVAALALGGGYSFGAESEIVKKFVDALEAKDAMKMNAVITENKDRIPAEVKTLLGEAAAPGVTEDERESKFYLAELLAKGYNDATGDFSVLKEVKKAVFNSKLSAPVRSKAVDGVHVVTAPEASDHTKFMFTPDNIIIKKGETVRWVNNDKTAHVLASLPVVGMGGIKATRIEAGASFEFKFEKPGEYYYMCYIHKGMVGKVTVEE